MKSPDPGDCSIGNMQATEIPTHCTHDEKHSQTVRGRMQDLSARQNYLVPDHLILSISPTFIYSSTLRNSIGFGSLVCLSVCGALSQPFSDPERVAHQRVDTLQHGQLIAASLLAQTCFWSGHRLPYGLLHAISAPVQCVD